jgi:hypothetical protein
MGLRAIGAVNSRARSHAFAGERVPAPLATVSASPEMISVMVIDISSAPSRIARVR